MVYCLITPMLRTLGQTRVLNGTVLEMVFDSASPGSLLLSNGARERFVVHASDKMIGKRVFVNREPYDFDKLVLVTELLGTEFQRTLLVDVGANIGTVCIPAITRGLFARAVAIEPDPANYALLVANIYLNHLQDKILTHHLAVGDTDGGTVLLERSPDNFGDHRVKISTDAGSFHEEGRATIPVKSETLDTVLGEINPQATLIWMDTQGFEGYVLAGASQALKQHTPLCLEFWPYGLARSGCYRLLKETLIQHGYRVLYNLDDPAMRIPLTPHALDELYATVGETGAFTDVLVL
jgi:FkbM family methyltransferase